MTYRKVKMSKELKREMRKQRKRFIKKFGREPEQDDPILFDEREEEPTAMTEEYLTEIMVDGMKKAGTPAHLIFAFRKTGLILTEDTYRMADTDVKDEWDAAMLEYFSMDERSMDMPQ